MHHALWLSICFLEVTSQAYESYGTGLTLFHQAWNSVWLLDTQELVDPMTHLLEAAGDTALP